VLNGKEKLIKLVRRRIFSGIIDFFVYSLFFALLLRLIGLIIDFLNINIQFETLGFIIITLLLILSFILYFGVMPKLTNGQTVGDFIMGVRVIKIDNSPLKILKLSKRTLSGIFSYIKFLSFRRVFFNPLGQFYYDKKFNTVVLDKKQIHMGDFKNVNIDTKYEYDFLLDPSNLKILLYIILIVIIIEAVENFIS